MFSIVTIESYVLYLTPLFLTGEYFYLKNDEEMSKYMFASPEFSSKYKDFT